MMRRLPAFLLVIFLFAGCGGAAVVQAPAPAPPSPAAAEGTPSATTYIPGADPALLAQELALDPAVRTGTLENGLVYYVRANAEPQNRAELRLVIDAGSILEEEDQRGLAHLLEHMAFNGTERFPEQELVNYLERIGMRFGPDLNAYTSFDETVYLLQVPTDDQELLGTGFEVLREWAGSITLDPVEIDKERGVVLEEWRLGRGAGARLQDQQFPVLFAGSRYAERLPIGDPEVVSGAPVERVRAFYEDWYRPDLMAVVAVGDFDLDAVEAAIREAFADLRAPEDAPRRPTFDVPTHEDTRFAIATDPEQTVTIVQLIHKAPPDQLRTIYDYRESLLDELYVQMLNARMRELTQRPGAPFLGGFAFQGGLVRAADAYGMAAVTPEGGVPRALETLLTEAARVRLHGFTPGELDRARADLLRAYEQAYRERENTPSRVFADAYIRHYLQQEAEPGIELEYELVQDLLPTITLVEVDARAEAATGEANRVVLVSAPEGEEPPSEATLRGVLTAVANREILAYEDTTLEGPLLEQPPAPGTIVAESEVVETGVIEWTLSNGARVILRPTDFRADEVLLAAFSPGGTSVYPDSLARVADFATAAVQAGGVGAFSATDLERALAGQAVSVGPFLGEREQGFRGSASPDDLETLFQLVYLHMTAPRRDADAFEALKERAATVLQNRDANPQTVFSDAIAAALTQDHPRRRPPTSQEVLALDVDEALSLYRDRFRTASDFTFVLVGTFDPEAVAPLAKRYLAALPAVRGAEAEPRDLGIRPAEGRVERTVRQGLEPQARVQLVFHGDLRRDEGKFDPMRHGDRYVAEQQEARRERYVLAALAEALSIRLREELREERSGVYGVGVNAAVDRAEGWYRVSIGFGADPERLDELIDAVYAEIALFQAEGPDPDIVGRVTEAGRRAEEISLRENRTWLNALAGAYRYGDAVEQYLYRDDLRSGLTRKAIREAARRYLDPDQVVRVVLLPQE